MSSFDKMRPDQTTVYQTDAADYFYTYGGVKWLTVRNSYDDRHLNGKEPIPGENQ